ncbi:MAG: isopentenyl-diphosphate Delta-isomerase [Candidatus Kryptonium sp.]
MKKEYVVAVDKHNRKLGKIEKLKAHRKGILHRAFSIFIFDSNGNLILQKRAENKYHSPLLWSNTCCGHPRPGERTKTAAIRRLKEELGIKCEIKKFGTIIYKLEVGDLIEHELNTLFFGFYTGKIEPNPDEVADIKFVKLDSLLSDVKRNPKLYTPWFHLILNHYSKELMKIQKKSKVQFHT